MFSITLIIIILTAIVSFTAFNNPKITGDLIFSPVAIKERNQWYRFLTCALLHADVSHLAFNMLSLYFFGELVEKTFAIIFGTMGGLAYVIIYIISQFLCLLPTYFQHRHNYAYRSLGASGAVSAIIFAGIVLFPLQKIYLFFIPIGIPGFIFGFIYLGVTAWLDKKSARTLPGSFGNNRGGSNINHSAHLYGALAGIGLLLLFGYTMSPYNLVENFIEQVRNFGR